MIKKILLIIPSSLQNYTRVGEKKLHTYTIYIRSIIEEHMFAKQFTSILHYYQLINIVILLYIYICIFSTL